MARIDKRCIEDVHYQPRGWGGEYWLENLPEYCGKILMINPGKRGSLHFHMKKLETMYLNSGRVDIRLIDPDTGKDYVVHLVPGDSIKIPRGQVHQIISAVDDDEVSELLEFSTEHEEEDSYRVQKGD